MVDIIVRGMEISRSCYQCDIGVTSEMDVCCPYYGIHGDARELYHYSRHPDCPLHELPPHGDLIDKDAFIQWLESQDELWERSYTVPQLKEMLRKGMPVIVPRSE